MSPSDSLGVVFKCLSKGATDFLVKPIRKNELRTLWQHVWRKCLTVSSITSDMTFSARNLVIVETDFGFFLSIVYQSSGGGSVAESDAVTHSKALVKSPGIGKSGSSSNDGDNVPCDPNNRSHGLSDRNGSDQGSGTEVLVADSFHKYEKYPSLNLCVFFFQQVPKDNRKQKPETPLASMAGQLSDPPMHNWDLNQSAGELEGHNLGTYSSLMVVLAINS